MDTDSNLADIEGSHLACRRPEPPLQLISLLNSPQRCVQTPPSSVAVTPQPTMMQPPSSSSVPRSASFSNQIVPQSLMSPMAPAPSDEPGLVPTLQNVVSTVNLSCELNLKEITFRTRNSEYNPQRFSGIVMRIREPHTTALVFRSGKMVVTGARNEDDSRLAARKFARIIQKLGFQVRFNDFKIQNIVGTYDLRFPIRVENLNQKHGQFSRYEPELFPGLIYRMVKPRVVLLIFVNGKLVMTGAKSRQELEEALESIYPILKSFKKQ